MKSYIVGGLAFILYFVNTIFWCMPIFIFSVFKLTPLKFSRRLITKLLDYCATCWISCNSFIQAITTSTRWQVSGETQFSQKDWYLVIANHQSWVDILVLQKLLNKRIPFLKFFLKQELIWVPFLGLAWWALDFPFMQRYSKAYLAKHPHLKGKDMETTKIACQKFKNTPVSVMNFVEGTRVSDTKRHRQHSPYQHLLKPKSGGVGFVLGAMGDQLNQIIDVTIVYPDGAPTFWQFISGGVDKIFVHFKVTPVKKLFEEGIFADDFSHNAEQRVAFQAWLNDQWQAKDSIISDNLIGDKQ